MAKIKKDDPLPVEVAIEFEGTIHNFVVAVEDQHVPMVGSGAKWSGREVIKSDGDPIKFSIICFGEIGSTLKKHELTINKKTFKGPESIKFKERRLSIPYLIPYRVFDLEEEKPVLPPPAATLVANVIVGQDANQ